MALRACCDFAHAIEASRAKLLASSGVTDAIKSSSRYPTARFAESPSQPQLCLKAENEVLRAQLVEIANVLADQAEREEQFKARWRLDLEKMMQRFEFA